MHILEVTFHGDAPGLPETAVGRIYRSNEHFVAYSATEDIRIFLEGIIERAPYVNTQSDRTALTIMKDTIRGGVNGFSLSRVRIKEVSQP